MALPGTLLRALRQPGLIVAIAPCWPGCSAHGAEPLACKLVGHTICLSWIVLDRFLLLQWVVNRAVLLDRRGPPQAPLRLLVLLVLLARA